MTQANVKIQLKELDKLVATSQKFDKRKVDLEGAPSALSVTKKGKFNFVKPGVEFFGNLPVAEAITGLNLEPNALRQLLQRVSVPYFGKGNGTTMDGMDWETMLNKYPQYFAAIMNDLLPQIESKGLLIRTEAKNIRAILTDRYGIVDNSQVLNAVREILVATGDQMPDLTIVKSSVDRDRLDMRIVFKNPKITNPELAPQGETRRGDIGNRPYGFGVYVGNEETGRGGMSVKTLAQRNGCTNSIIIESKENIQLRHLGETQVLLGRLQQSFADILPIGAQVLNRIYEVTNKALPNLADVLNGLSKSYGWDDDAQSQILIGTEGQETVMGLVNGVSFAASKIEDSAKRVEMEIQAGAILTANDSLFARAAQQSINARR
jgi:hypothetical protein